MFLMYMNLFVLIFTSNNNKIYAEKDKNTIETLNESSIYYMTILACLFTDYNPDREMRYQIGWVSIGFFFVTLLANFFVGFKSSFRWLSMIAILLCNKFNSKKLRKEKLDRDRESGLVQREVYAYDFRERPNSFAMNILVIDDGER
jgi:tRNA (Thr-GGU) A37 N-methylase